MAKILSLNGVDKVGKSTQARWLSLDSGSVAIEVAAPLSQFHPAWREIADMTAWWFSPDNTDDFIDVILDSVRFRRESAESSRAQLVVFDRGLDMYFAVLVASIQVKLGATYEEAHALVADRLHRKGGAGLGEDTALLLTHGDATAGQKMTFQRGDPSEHSEADRLRYAHYQTLLHQALRERGQDAEFVPIDARGPILAVQNQIRGVIRDRLGLTLPDLGRNIRRLIGLGGLSESGKSSVGDRLSREHGFGRLKIRYFAELMARRVGDVHALSVEEFVRLFVQELNGYANAHPFVENFSIESLHDPDLPAQLIKVFGDRFRVIYCECDRDLAARRIARDQELPLERAVAIVAAKDKTKLGRGADRVKELAHHPIDNNGTREALLAAVDGIARGDRLKHPPFRPRVASVFELNMPESYAGVVAGVASAASRDFAGQLVLFCAAGSAGRGRAQEGWSDLDLVLVCDAPYRDMIPWVVRQQQDKPIKPGLLLLHLQDLQARRVIPGKWVFVADQLNRGVIPALECRRAIPSPEGLTAESVIAGRLFKSIAHAVQAILAVSGVRIAGFEELPTAGAYPWKSSFPRLADADEVRAGRVTLRELCEQGITLLDWWVQEQL
jgi:thymidylate kinase